MAHFIRPGPSGFPCGAVTFAKRMCPGYFKISGASSTTIQERLGYKSAQPTLKIKTGHTKLQAIRRNEQLRASKLSLAVAGEASPP